jgi:hypothetical protein
MWLTAGPVCTPVLVVVAALAMVATVLAADAHARDAASPAVTDPVPVLQTTDTLVNERRPAVEGVRRYGHRLVADPGDWSPEPDRVRYRWFRNGDPIRGAESPATRRIQHRMPVRHRVTYHVATRGRITARLATFKRQAQATFDAPRGWRAAGVAFRRVARRGDFTLVLSQASRVPSFSSGCSAQWSCRVGRYVIINQTRWQRASPMWNDAGRSRRDYRHMVVNHETGHWLGHGHRGCTGRRDRAPVMQQQSIALDGCRPNPWPKAGERHTPRFG